MRVAGLAAAVAVLLAGCGRGVERPPERVLDGWSAPQYTASEHTGQGPEFSDRMPGWVRRDSWDTTVRAFTDGWALADGPDAGPGARPDGSFPLSMNGCAQQRFLVRWRSLDGSKFLTASGYYEDALNVMGVEHVTTEPATAGWMDLDGCSGPVWKLIGPEDTLTDLAVSVERWEPVG